MLPTMTGAERKIQRSVFFSGTTALRKGQSVCYDANRTATQDGTTTALTDMYSDRNNVVELPSTANNWWYAGVADIDYPANANGQWITINEPGSVCEIALAGTAALTADSSRLSFLVSAPTGYTGLFQREGLPGRGTATLLQSVALGTASAGVATSTESVNAPILAVYSGDYTQSSGQIASTGIEGKAAVGDTVIIMSGERAATSANHQAPAVSTVATVGTNYITLDTAPTLTGDGHVSVSIYRGNPTALAYLETGEESGGVQYICSDLTASASVASATPAKCGMIYVDLAATMTADLTITLAAPVSRQSQIGVYAETAGGNSQDLLVAGTIGAPLAAGTAFSSGDLDAAGDRYFFKAVAGMWVLSGAYIA